MTDSNERKCGVTAGGAAGTHVSIPASRLWAIGRKQAVPAEADPACGRDPGEGTIPPPSGLGSPPLPSRARMPFALRHLADSGPSRSARRLVCAGTVCWIVASSGCCLWRNQNPIKESVVESRQYVQQGVNALERKDLDEAERLLSQAVRACPDDAEAHCQYAELLWQRQRLDESLRQIEMATKIDPNDAEILIRAGELYRQASRWQQAQSYAERAIDLDPKSAEAWLLRGRVLYQAGQTRHALADVQRSLHYAPRSREALQLSAELYRKLDEPHRALVSLQALADTYSPGEEPQQLFIEEGLAYATLQRHADAAQALRQAQRRGPPTTDLLLLTCEAESAAGDATAAFRAAQQAVAMAPADPRCRELLQRTAAAVPAPGTTLRR